MAMDKTLTPVVDFEVIDDKVVTFDEDDVLLDDSDPTEITLADGSVQVEIEGEGEDEGTPVTEHDDNLAEHIDESDLRALAMELVRLFDADKRSRAKWEKGYTDGLELLGLDGIEDRSEPFEGASGVFHPILSEAVVRFQSQTIGELIPAKGPVKTAIVGKYTEEKDRQAKRVQNYMNYTIMNKMTEYRRETDRLLWDLPLAGCAFRKVYQDAILGRPAAKFIPAKDVVINYAAESIETAERVTHVQRKSPNEVKQLQASGFYRDDIDLPAPNADRDAIQDKYDELQGKTDTTLEADPRHQILEMHTVLNLIKFESPIGIADPYIVTLDKSSWTILSIYRNWDEEDENREREQYFAHYEFIPGFGMYAYGLTHLIGSLSKAATGVLRQLLDAGTFSNFPGGLKTRGLRVKGDDTPIQPGEWRDTDVPAGKLSENLFPMPYKEPSATLFQLLELVIRDGRSFASMADINVADMSSDAPVGTTLAIMERALKIQTAIQQRIHDSMKAELKILARIIKDYTIPEYPYEVDEGEGIKESDFDDRVDIIPVSDPNASTFAQRMMQYQAVVQLAQGNPEIYDQKRLHRQIVETLGVPGAELLVPIEEETPPTDPVTENMNFLNLAPVKAYEYQDHEAHLRVHATLQKDPNIQQQLQNSPTGPAIAGALDSHLREHMAFVYRFQIEQELGVELPPLGQPIPEDVEKNLSTLVADAADQLTGKKAALAEAERVAAELEDPIVQQGARELDLKEGELQRRTAADRAREKIEILKLQLKEALETEKTAQRDREAMLEHEGDMHHHGVETQIKGIELGVKIAKGGDSGGSE